MLIFFGLLDFRAPTDSHHFFSLLYSPPASNFYDKNATHDQGLLWSSIKYTLNFDNHAMPLPLVVSTSRVSEAQQTTNSSDLTVIPLSNTQFEFTREQHFYLTNPAKILAAPACKAGGSFY